MSCLCKLDHLVILNHAGCPWQSSRFLLTLFPVWFCLMGFLHTFQPPCNLGFICDFKLSFEYITSTTLSRLFFFHLCRNSAKAQVLLSQQGTEGLIYVWITAQVELLQQLVLNLPDWLLHGVLCAKFTVCANVFESSTPHLYKAVNCVGMWHCLNLRGFSFRPHMAMSWTIPLSV